MADRSRSGVLRRIWLAVLVLVLAGVATGIFRSRDPVRLPAAAAAEPVPSAAPAAPSVSELTTAVLKAQSAALIKGDERGWLAAVDPGRPKLRARYASMFRSLRGLGVSQFEHHVHAPSGPADGTVRVRTHISYCFSRVTCPAYVDQEWAGPPRIAQALTFQRVAGRYVITELTHRGVDLDKIQPTPWESGDLFFAHGKRVTVAATRSQRTNLDRVLSLAERAAVVTDRYAAFVANPQPRYRIYLADDRAWKSWYGGERDKWVVGLAVPLNDAGTDTVLRMAELGDSRLLATTIQHEMGHVVTLSGAITREPTKDRWLTEGIAEYIGWAPRPATASWRRLSVRAAFGAGRRPATMVGRPLGAKASDRTVDAFYGLGHFAADCMAQRYGERKLFTFVRLVLREENTYDQAARAAYGQPFAAVDKACVAWIKKQI